MVSRLKDSDIALAEDLVEQDKVEHKIVELPFVVESETLEARIEGKYRTISIKDFTPGKEYSYIVDVDPSSFDEPHVVEAIDLSKTIFVNAVMGLMPHFWHGTYKMDEMIDCNRSAQKFFGGGDTLQEFKSLHPGLYQKALESPKYYLFTGGGTVLKVIEEGDPFALPTVKALIENGKQYGYNPQ
jgi:phosphoglycerate kinase